jgi:serine/threonine-protein kinase HipA
LTSGRIPTTHILKPPSEGFDGHAENEHLCLALARALGLPAAKSEVRRFEDVTAIVIERYDRVRMGAQMRRVHQEDMCQALRIHPANKYQNDGGPGPAEIADLLRAHATTPPALVVNTFAVNTTGAPRPTGDVDVRTFIDALVFNWLIGGTDAHAKNYSILIGGGGLVRLAPLYDLASILAYPDIDAEKAKLAMKIGGEYRLRRIGYAQWRKLAAEIRVDAEALVERARKMASELPDRVADEATRARQDGLDHRAVRRMIDPVSRRAALIAGS